MVIEALPRTRLSTATGVLDKSSCLKITLFHCFNVLDNPRFDDNSDVTINSIKLPCSSMTRETVLLKAFEAGADAVLVLVCPPGLCRHLDGNVRAAKRVERVKKLLDEIGIDGRRLNLFNIPVNDQASVDQIIEKTISDLAMLGPNPASVF
ncbi:MAG: hydrogenase iron-sulfur subunit [Dehalococcoidales bacterium]|nr:hydrogenase iron-sulfur subunit [Dehalococcoidales bacterium]